MSHNFTERRVIAIDGPAGAGKSTAAKLLARKLGYIYLDTGLMYRALAWAALQQGVLPDTPKAVSSVAQTSGLCFRLAGEHLRAYAAGRDITGELRNPEMNRYSSLYSAYAPVREYLWEQQRRLGEQGKVVMEGRDIGTVVFPAADFKFFLDASPEVRAQRRYRELLKAGTSVTLEETTREQGARDRNDSARLLAPLKPAPDAIIIDSGELGVAEVVERMLEVIRAKCNKSIYAR